MIGALERLPVLLCIAFRFIFQTILKYSWQMVIKQEINDRRARGY